MIIEIIVTIRYFNDIIIIKATFKVDIILIIIKKFPTAEIKSILISIMIFLNYTLIDQQSFQFSQVFLILKQLNNFILLIIKK